MIASRSAHLLEMGAAAHDDRAAAGVIRLADAVAPHDDAAGREIRSRHMLDQLVDGDLRIVEIGDAGVDHLRQIVGRDVGRHADRDAAGAVDQQVREARRQDGRLLATSRRSSAGNRPCPCRDRRAAPRPPWRAAPRCSASPPADRRPSSRNCPGRRSAARAWKNPAPCAPARRRSTGRRAGDTYP